MTSLNLSVRPAGEWLSVTTTRGRTENGTTHDANLLRRLDAEREVLQNCGKMRRVSDNQVLNDEVSIARWPRCRWPAAFDHRRRFLRNFEIFYDTFNRVKFEFDLSEHSVLG